MQHRDLQTLLRLEQPCTATAQGCLFISQVIVTCAQVLGWKGNLEGQDLCASIPCDTEWVSFLMGFGVSALYLHDFAVSSLGRRNTKIQSFFIILTLKPGNPKPN
jgi:hypothetical protein